MKNSAILYGSSLGNTKFVAEKISKLLPSSSLSTVSSLKKEDVERFDSIILGVSTWGIGGLQDEFETFVDTLLASNLQGKTIAFFGLGDQQTYPDTYCNALGKLYDLLGGSGCDFVGAWPIDGYDFSQSLAVRNNMFVGLALDEENQPDLTDYRVKKWVDQIKGDII